MLKNIQKQELIIKVISKHLTSGSKEVNLNLIFNLNGKLVEATTFRNFNIQKGTISKIIHDNFTKRYEYSDVYLPKLHDLKLKDSKSEEVAKAYELNKEIFKEKLLELIQLETEYELELNNDLENNYLYNVEFLETDMTLDIYKLSEKDELEIVSVEIQSEEDR